jgi:glucosamine-6-phosphate deaminase
VGRVVAERIADVMRRRRHQGKKPVLGLATGSTPVVIYRELIRMHNEEGLSFADTVTFNLDEYYPMHPGSIHSYHRFMRENLFDQVDLLPENVHLPRGDIPRDEVEAHAQEYEEAIRRAGGIDFQILGVGRSGHIGFNEPGSGRNSRTRLIYLDTITRKDAAADFFSEENVPAEAVTMGVATILQAREIALVATGEHKARIVQRAVEGEVHPDVAATYLQEHPNATFYLDPAAAGELTRVRTPRCGFTAGPGRSGRSARRTCWCRSRKTSCAGRSWRSSSTSRRRTRRPSPVPTNASSGSAWRTGTGARPRTWTSWGCPPTSRWRRTW